MVLDNCVGAANVRVHLTAPEPDPGNVMQPNYLNVNITLGAAPVAELHVSAPALAKCSTKCH